MGIKRNRLMALFGTALVLLLLGDGTAGPAANPREIRVITPQWEGQTNADGTGLFFDIIRAVYEPGGVVLRLSFAPWKRCQDMVSSGRQDAMLCVWKSHAGEMGQLIPSIPLYIEETAVVVKKASGLVWKGIHSLDYRRAVWLRGYDYHTAPRMKEVQLSTWHEVDSHEEAWHQLNLDRFDAYIDARIDIDAFLNSGRAEAGLYQTYPLWKQKAYVAFSHTPSARALLRIYDTRAVSLLDSGELERIYEKWGVDFDPGDWGE